MRVIAPAVIAAKAAIQELLLGDTSPLTHPSRHPIGPVLSWAAAMPHQTEPNVNVALGNLLQAMLPKSRVLAENTQTIAGSPGLKPDILITAPGRSPVVVEAEYMPAATVEKEAKERLGLKAASNGRIIEASIALRYAETIGDVHDLTSALSSAQLSYCVFTGEPEDPDRFPESGWLDGSVEDLADMVRLVSVPQMAVDEATNILKEGIESASKLLDDLKGTKPGITASIARLLGMIDVPQTRRMACAIIANALVFHERIVGMHPEVESLAKVCGDDVPNPQGRVLAAWGDILKINYWSIFAIARDILQQLPSGDAAAILRELRDTAQSVDATDVDNAHDLTGRVFQRLIADRKYLATFYTLPASAALLARLAVAKMEGIEWGNMESLRNLRVADFACGTGALLSAVYEQVAARHERAGGDSAALHKVMMEEVLYGCDVMPSAVHITGSTLSGMEPSVLFEKSHLYTMPYGRQEDGSVKIGSLELLQSSNVLTLFNTSDPALSTGSTGEETAAQILADIPDESFDLIIMNPPFTRNVTRQGATANTVAAAFAAFGASDEDQRAMATQMGKLKTNTCYHGNAGMASAFSALGHRKLKPGGVLALVLPLVATAGLSWQGFREMLARKYTDLTLLSIAADSIRDISFSADTGLGECLVIARKLKMSETPSYRGQFVSLRERPQLLANSSSISKSVVSCGPIRRIEDGPYGGTSLSVGDGLSGTMVAIPCSIDGEPWGGVRISDYSLAQTAYALSQGNLWLPGRNSGLTISIAELREVGKLGTYHLDVVGPLPRGPFDRLAANPTATYHALWNHDASRETQMICEPDSSLQVRPGMESKAHDVWATASPSHLNIELRFNTQPLAVAITELDSLAGSAWSNVVFSDQRFDHAFALWSNSTLGFLAYWWQSSRQDTGRGRTTVRAAESLPVLDLRTLTNEQLLMAEIIFKEFRDKELMPAYLADADPNRALLDRRVICDLLGLDEDTYVAVRRLAAKWCAEPSVHGGKARPKGATLVF